MCISAMNAGVTDTFPGQGKIKVGSLHPGGGLHSDFCTRSLRDRKQPLQQNLGGWMEMITSNACLKTEMLNKYQVREICRHHSTLAKKMEKHSFIQ